jgi:uncharacterized protein
MSIFRITAVHPQTGANVILNYDNETSALTLADGRFAVPRIEVAPRAPVFAVSADTPGSKTSPRVLKLVLGLSCNYECSYCSQRFVPRADETSRAEVEPFLAGLDSWVTSPPQKVEFWGGEPLVYVKTLIPLAEALRDKWPSTVFSMITNGSLLTREINAWLDGMGFTVAISHDGPGQRVRGPDPLDVPETRDAILDLHRRLRPNGRISFNAMLNNENLSRAEIAKFFIELTGDAKVSIGEGHIVDAYDWGGLSLSLRDSDAGDYRRKSFEEIRTGAAASFHMVRSKVADFVNSIRTARPSSVLGQKCSMDRPDKMAVDLKGNVLTCQNTSAVSTAPNGQQNKIGHVSDMAGVKLKTATHWSHREECPKCPMLHICSGSCMFLEGPLWEASCNNAFSDAVPIFAAAIESMTGLVPVRIDGPQREDRKMIWDGPQPAQQRRVIPLKVA